MKPSSAYNREFDNAFKKLDRAYTELEDVMKFDDASIRWMPVKNNLRLLDVRNDNLLEIAKRKLR